MKSLTFICLASFFAFNTYHYKRITISNNIIQNIKKRAVTTPNVDFANNIHLKNVCVHAFSDIIKKDTFKIDLSGKTILDGNVVFQILDFKGKKIYKQSFTGLDMLGELTDAELTVKQKEDTIREKITNFFKEDRFVKPAIARAETFDDAYSSPNKSDEKEWNSVKADRNTIGFMYSFGYEGMYGITYSRTTHKVFLYFYSD